MTESPRPGLTGRRFASNAEADQHDAEYWRRLSPAERVLFAWRLSVEQWELQGRRPDEPGLGRIMRVPVTPGPGAIRAGVPEPAVTAPALFTHNGFVLDRRSRILALSTDASRPEPPTVILNWRALLR